MRDAIEYVIGGIALIIFVYAIIRVGSFAYFRTKYEHLRRVMHDVRKQEQEEKE